MKLKSYYEMGYDELERLIEETWPVLKNKVELIADNEWNNYSCYTFTPEYDDEEEEKDYINNLDNGILKKYNPSVSVYLQALIDRNKLPAGDYLITVYW